MFNKLNSMSFKDDTRPNLWEIVFLLDYYISMIPYDEHNFFLSLLNNATRFTVRNIDYFNSRIRTVLLLSILVAEINLYQFNKIIFYFHKSQYSISQIYKKFKILY